MKCTLVAVIAVIALASACGPPCRSIADARDALRSNRPAITRPHAQVLLPHTLANRLLAAAVKQTPPIPVKAPVLAPIFEPLLGTLALSFTRAQLVPAPAGRLGLDLTTELRAERETLATVHLRTWLLPRVRRKDDGSRVLELGLDADSVRRLRPEISPGAAEQIAALLEARLPGAIRALTPRAVITAAASKLVAWLGEEGFALLRRPLLRRLGAISGLRVQLPDLPLQRVELRTLTSPHNALALDLYTALLVRAALPTSPSPLPASPDALQVRVAGSAVAELTNWAIDEGLLPRRYDKELRPDPEGGFRPHFDWRVGQPRPLKVHVFRTRRPCAHVLVGARAEVQVKGEKLKLTITDRQVEHVEGPPLVKLGIWLDGLWSTAVRKTKERAAAVVLKHGKHQLKLRIREAVLTDDELAFSLGVGL